MQYLSILHKVRFLSVNGKADYLVTGTWSEKAAKEVYYPHYRGFPNGVNVYV